MLYKILILIFPAKLLSKKIAPIYTPTKSVRRIPISSKVDTINLLYFWYVVVIKTMSYDCFNLHYSKNL